MPVDRSPNTSVSTININGLNMLVLSQCLSDWIDKFQQYIFEIYYGKIGSKWENIGKILTKEY